MEPEHTDAIGPIGAYAVLSAAPAYMVFALVSMFFDTFAKKTNVNARCVLFSKHLLRLE
jgi:hypothetical protein